MAWIAGASSYASLQGAVALLGAGGGALNGATNTLVADLHEDPKRKAAALNLLGVFFGVGALMMPFAMGSLLEALGLRTLLVAGAVLCATVGVAAAVLRYPAPKAPARLPVSEMPGLLRVALVPAMGALLFFQSGNEFLMGGYLSTFLTQGLGATVERASLLLALMWGSILVARIGLSRLLRKADPHWTVIVSAAVASAACALIASAGSPAGAAPAVALAGVSFAGIFPTVLGVAGARFESRSGTVIGLLLTMALVGGMSVPWAAGHLAAAAGPRAIFWMAAVNAAATCGLAGVVRRLDR
jgi:fucose permease